MNIMFRDLQSKISDVTGFIDKRADHWPPNITDDSCGAHANIYAKPRLAR